MTTMSMNRLYKGEVGMTAPVSTTPNVLHHPIEMVMKEPSLLRHLLIVTKSLMWCGWADIALKGEARMIASVSAIQRVIDHPIEMTLNRPNLQRYM